MSSKTHAARRAVLLEAQQSHLCHQDRADLHGAVLLLTVLLVELCGARMFHSELQSLHCCHFAFDFF